jgi:hypothetical protein
MMMIRVDPVLARGMVRSDHRAVIQALDSAPSLSDLADRLEEAIEPRFTRRRTLRPAELAAIVGAVDGLLNDVGATVVRQLYRPATRVHKHEQFERLGAFPFSHERTDGRDGFIIGGLRAAGFHQKGASTMTLRRDDLTTESIIELGEDSEALLRTVIEAFNALDADCGLIGEVCQFSADSWELRVIYWGADDDAMESHMVERAINTPEAARTIFAGFPSRKAATGFWDRLSKLCDRRVVLYEPKTER